MQNHTLKYLQQNHLLTSGTLIIERPAGMLAMSQTDQQGKSVALLAFALVFLRRDRVEISFYTSNFISIA